MADGVLLDIDGVLTVSWDALPGAAEVIHWLQAEGIEFCLVTNTSSKSRDQIAARLAGAGMPVDADRILTAARYLNEHLAGVGCLVVNEGDISQDLEGVAMVDARSAGVVLLGGAGPSTGYRELDAVFKLAVDGVPVVALHRNARYQTADGPALDMGAFIVGIEAAAQTEVTVVGKPAEAFFHAAQADLGTRAESTVVVGDDIDSDVLGAQATGMIGVLVRTGKFRPSDLEGAEAQPDHVIDGIGDLPALWPRLGPDR
jgi:HAD superfamily hydrolase (TIGR01458 family)